MSKGYTQVQALLGGWNAWVSDGGATEPVTAAEKSAPAPQPTPTPTPTPAEAKKPAAAASTTKTGRTKTKRARHYSKRAPSAQ